MPLEKRLAALESLVGGISERLVALERRMEHQSSNEALHQSTMQVMKEGMKALEGQTPANSATREIMWRRIEALEGAPSEELPPMIAGIFRRLAALEERTR